jgi:hypothetical protein
MAALKEAQVATWTTLRQADQFRVRIESVGDLAKPGALIGLAEAAVVKEGHRHLLEVEPCDKFAQS